MIAAACKIIRWFYFKIIKLMLLGRFGFCNRGFVQTKFRIRKKFIDTAHLKNITMVATICVLCIISNRRSKEPEPKLPRFKIKIHKTLGQQESVRRGEGVKQQQAYQPEPQCYH